MGWSDESRSSEAPARDEARRAAGDLSHRRREKRGWNGVGGVGGRERSQDSSGKDQSWKVHRKAEDTVGNQSAQAIRRVSAREAGKIKRGDAHCGAVCVAGRRVTEASRVVTGLR